MYRYHQHLMNDENWNRDLKKPDRLPADASQEHTIHENTDHSQTIKSPVDTVSKAGNSLTVDYHPENVIPETPPEIKNDTHITRLENNAHSKTINTPVATVTNAGPPLAVDYHPENVIPETPPESNNNTHITPQENSTHSKIISFPVASVSKARNPVAADYHPENGMPETTPPETKKDMLINAEQDEEKKMEELNNGKRDINQQMRWPVSKGAKKRKKGNHTWMFILTGFIISLVSGILMYTWIAQSKKNEFVSSLESFSVETAEASENDLYAYGNQEDTDFIADEFMDQDDNPEYVNEDAFNDPDMADLEDNMDVIEEPVILSDNMAEFDSWDELELTPVEENSAMAIKKPLEYPKEIADVADEKKIVIKEKSQENEDQTSEVMITKAAVREAPAVSLKKEKKEKIEQLAQLLASSDIAPYKKQIDLTEDVQSGVEKNVDKDKSQNKTVNAASDQGEQTPVTKKLAEKADTHQVSVSKKLPGADKKKISASKQHKNHPVKKEKNVTALNDKQQPLKAEIPALRVSDLEHHKPVKAILVANALPQRESVSSLNYQKGEQTGNTKKKEKTSIKAALAVKKANVQKQDQKHRGTVLLAQNKKSESKSSSPNYQPAKTVALREMAVTYVDQFNDHTNHWPEYNNDRASVLIEEGEYHVENKAKSGSHIVLHPYGVSNDMNYMIHIDISSVRGTGKNTYGFVFGGKDINNNYSFQIHSDNSYSIKKRLGGNEEKLAGGQIDNVFISKHSGKTLKIVKLHNKVRFYVDDYYLDELKNVEFNGDKVGFLVEGKVKISVDSTRTEIKFSSNQ